ncbi:CDP-glucose 4,6-dehydratase [Lachnospiraceae bacterium]|nr:CDP-glucose 4,6-dehydratase [Lachnospiraceae bacterium]
MKLDFYRDKRVLITGHTGFKGSWMCAVLAEHGAYVLGYSLEPPTEPNLYEMLRISEKIDSRIGDVRDLQYLLETFKEFKPEIVIHMAAQPIVRESYMNPVYTYEVNVMGTVNVLEAIRCTESVKSAVIVTTDKVYKNKEWIWGYREDEELNGLDPYSNSKSCAELVTDSYINSYFKEESVAVSTVRAGNVIGGGDFAIDRIIPDCYRAASSGCDIVVRNPYSTRPYQHVLEPVMAYLNIAAKQYENYDLASSYNIGPDIDGCLTTGTLVNLFCESWNMIFNDSVKQVEKIEESAPHEADCLKLDNSKYKSVFAWKTTWDIAETIERTVTLYAAIYNREDIWACMRQQIADFEKEFMY